MITLIYTGTFLASLALLGSMLYKNKKIESIHALLGVLVCVACLGELLVCFSNSLEMAKFGHFVCYIGTAYTTWLLVVIIARTCNLKMPRWLNRVMLCYATLVILLQLSANYTGLYYTDVHLETYKDATILVRTYGPLHFIYPVYLVCCAVIMIAYSIYAIKTSEKVSTRTVVSMSLVGVMVIVTYIIEKMMNSIINYDSVAYMIASLFMMRVFDHVNKYDMSINIMRTVQNMEGYGYIELDLKYRFIDANQYIQEKYPEIENVWRVDYAIPVSDSVLYTEVVEWATGKYAPDEKIIHLGETCYDVRFSPLYYNEKKKIGYLIEMIDRTKEHQYTHAIEDFNDRLKKEVEVKTDNILKVQDKLVLGMASMVESRDNSTGGHINRTSAVVEIFAKRLAVNARGYHFTEQFLKQVTQAAPMHDLGKIAVDDAVLRKQGKFTDEEYAQMKKHSEEGAKIVERILRGVKEDDFVDIAKNVAYYHHEKWNGQGYPKGLSGKEIPIEARIMALADVFDALVSKRCYKEAFSYDKAFNIIEESLGSHFDPELGKCFLACREDLEAYYDAQVDK